MDVAGVPIIESDADLPTFLHYRRIVELAKWYECDSGIDHHVDLSAKHR